MRRIAKALSRTLVQHEEQVAPLHARTCVGDFVVVCGFFRSPVPLAVRFMESVVVLRLPLIRSWAESAAWSGRVVNTFPTARSRWWWKFWRRSPKRAPRKRGSTGQRMASTRRGRRRAAALAVKTSYLSTGPGASDLKVTPMAPARLAGSDHSGVGAAADTVVRGSERKRRQSRQSCPHVHTKFVGSLGRVFGSLTCLST